MATGSATVQEIPAGLHDLPACDVSDALVRLGVPTGGLLPGLHMVSPELGKGPTKIVGRAFTIKIVEATDEESPKYVGDYTESFPKDHIVLIQMPEGVRSACWGGLMTAAAMARGVVGVVMDGGVRDLDDSRKAGFPLFSRYHSTVGPPGLTRPSALDVPLTFQPVAPRPGMSTTVQPGDILVCDVDGCVAVPSALAEEVASLGHKIKGDNERMQEAIEGGMSFGEAMAKFRS